MGRDTFWGYVTGHFIRFARDLGAQATDFQDRLGDAESHIDKSVYDGIRERFDLPEAVEDSDTLYPEVPDSSVMPLVLSYLETRPVVRALRIQSMYSFYRSMYAASFLVVGITVLSLIVKAWRDPWVSPWGTVALVLLLGSISIAVFRVRRRKFKDRFVNYTILDFYVDSVTEE